MTLSLIATAVAAGPGRADDPSPVPTAWPSSRYQKLMDRSPFALATLVDAHPEPQASFAADWFVSGIGRLDGEDFVTIKSRDRSTQFSLYGREASEGIILSGIEWSEKTGKSTVAIKKGMEIAKLEFNEAIIQGPAEGIATRGEPPPGAKASGAPSVAAAKPPTTPLPATVMGRPLPQRPPMPGVVANQYPPGPRAAGNGAPLQGQNRNGMRFIKPPQHQ